MQDKYFYTTEQKNNLTAALGLTDLDGNPSDNIAVGIDNTYFESAAFILLWVGKIPKTYDDNGNITSYEADGADHFNVRPKTSYPDFGQLTVTEVTPNSPYSIFA